MGIVLRLHPGPLTDDAGPAVSLRLVAFGFLAWARWTIAVDSYGRSPTNAQSVYELSSSSSPGVQRK